MELNDRLLAAQQAARLAGDMILANRPETVSRKGRNDYVTEMDVRSEKTIREYLLSRFPADAFWGEEGGESGEGKYEWIVDPIDGTTNYIKGLAMYSVSIGLSVDGEWSLGVVYAPQMGELFSAVRGGGAFMNGQPISVSDEDCLKKSVSAMSFAHRSEAGNRRMMRLLPDLTGSVNDLRRLGSAAYDLCLVACGRLDAFFELCLNAYDIAAGTVIAQEAGAVITGWDEGDDFHLSGNILAAAPPLHAPLQALLRAHP